MALLAILETGGVWDFLDEFTHLGIPGIALPEALALVMADDDGFEFAEAGLGRRQIPRWSNNGVDLHVVDRLTFVVGTAGAWRSGPTFRLERAPSLAWAHQVDASQELLILAYQDVFLADYLLGSGPGAYRSEFSLMEFLSGCRLALSPLFRRVYDDGTMTLRADDTQFTR